MVWSWIPWGLLENKYAEACSAHSSGSGVENYLFSFGKLYFSVLNIEGCKKKNTKEKEREKS